MWTTYHAPFKCQTERGWNLEVLSHQVQQRDFIGRWGRRQSGADSIHFRPPIKRFFVLSLQGSPDFYVRDDVRGPTIYEWRRSPSSPRHGKEKKKWLRRLSKWDSRVETKNAKESRQETRRQESKGIKRELQPLHPTKCPCGSHIHVDKRRPGLEMARKTAHKPR